MDVNNVGVLENIKRQKSKHAFQPLHTFQGVPCCTGAGSRGIKLRPHAAIFPPRGPSAGYERPSRPFGLRSLTLNKTPLLQ